MRKTFYKPLFYLIMLVSIGIYGQQEKVYSGTVTDDDGNAIPGVNVLIKERNTGTTTDADGAFSILASPGQTLEYSYMGFKTEIIELGASSNLSITLGDGKMNMEFYCCTSHTIRHCETNRELLLGDHEPEELEKQ